MAWIKRNLYFLIGSVAALALMGLAGFYLYSKWQANNDILDQLNAQCAELERLNQDKPHPGSGKVDNVKTAKEQQQQLRDFIAKARKNFQTIPRVPDAPKVGSQEFISALRQTISDLQHQATNASVGLPPNYSFSFEAERTLVTFGSGSLEPLSVQLGEVKAICDILIQAKVNSLDDIRRERIAAEDGSGPQTDYLAEKTITNDLAILTPYEITLRCFSSELALVLSGFASSPYGFLVKTINVEPAPVTAETPVAPVAAVVPVQPFVPQPTLPKTEGMNADQQFAQRYGISPGGGPRGRGGFTPPPPQQPVYVPPVAAAPSAGTTSRGGLPTVLDEKQLKVTLMVNLVKLTPTK